MQVFKKCLVHQPNLPLKNGTISSEVDRIMQEKIEKISRFVSLLEIVSPYFLVTKRLSIFLARRNIPRSSGDKPLWWALAWLQLCRINIGYMYPISGRSLRRNYLVLKVEHVENICQQALVSPCPSLFSHPCVQTGYSKLETLQPVLPVNLPPPPPNCCKVNIKSVSI